MKAIGIVSENKNTTYTLGRIVSKVNEVVKFIEFDNGSRIKIDSIFSEIGNEKLASWNDVDKIRKSKSDSKKLAFIQSMGEKLNETFLYKYSK